MEAEPAAKVMVSTPCFGGLLHRSYVQNIIHLPIAFMSAGMQLKYTLSTGEALISRARNAIVRNFIQSECSHLFLIDADICFSASDVIKLIRHNKDVVAAGYPLKHLFWDEVNPSMAESHENIRQMAIRYDIKPRFNSEADRQNGYFEMVDGLIEVEEAHAGFMCIKRSVIESMIAAYPETRFISDELHSYGQESWTLFNTMINENKRYLAEDSTFCKRWIDIGGSIWLDPDVILDHYGWHVFEGSPALDDSQNQITKVYDS